MAADTILCNKLNITVTGYLDMLQKQDRAGLVHFIRERFTERYITPIKSIPLTRATMSRATASARWR
jgi:hypothetical protein